jgi:Flp pilus assembly protein protease CpaA
MPAESGLPGPLVVSSLPVNLAALAVLVAVSIVDLRTRRVPQIVTMPLLALLCLWRLWRGDSIVFLYWLAAFSLYAFHVCGAGDVKVILIELALWPSAAFVIVLGLTVAVLGTLVSTVHYRSIRACLRRLQIAGARLLSGCAPSETELAASGAPQVFLFVAGAAIYLALSYSMQHAMWGGLGG